MPVKKFDRLVDAVERIKNQPNEAVFAREANKNYRYFITCTKVNNEYIFITFRYRFVLQGGILELLQ